MLHPRILTTEAEIDAMLEDARNAPEEPVIVEAAYHPGPGLEFLMLKLSNGRRLLIPREDLSELDHATTEQAVELAIIHNGDGIWWPQIDDGIYLPDFLEYRWGKERQEPQTRKLISDIPVAA